MAAQVSRSQPWPVRLAEQRGLYYGWLVVAVTFLALLVSAGVRQAPGVVLKPLEEEFGWSRASISAAVAVSILMFGLAGPFAGRFMAGYGARRVVLWATVLTLIGSLGTIWMSSLAEFTFWWGLVVGAGTGGLAVVMAAAVANTWFVTRRGFVTGLLGAGSSGGQFVFINALMALTLTHGWRTGFGLLVAALGFLVLPLAWLLMRNSPAEVGLEPYGAGQGSAAAQAQSGPLTPMSEALRCGFTSNGLIGTHFIPHAVEHGFTPEVAAGTLALIGAMNVVGTTVSGYLTDRYNPRILLAIYYGLRAASLLALPLISDIVGLTAFAIVFGLDFIATVPPTSILTANRFGRRSVGWIFGWIFCAHQVGGAAASWGGGIVYEQLGSYQVAFLAAAALGFVAAGLSLRIHTGKPELATAAV
jgi:predicted MFS family arabinose efflux permease